MIKRQTQTCPRILSAQLLGNIGASPPYFQGRSTLEIPPQAITTRIKLEFEIIPNTAVQLRRELYTKEMLLFAVNKIRINPKFALVQQRWI